MEESGSGLWGIITIVGPIVLALAVLWAIVNNRRSRSEKDRTERAVHEQKQEERRREGIS